MNKQIHKVFEKIEKKNLSNIKLLALVTETSYEVIFYAKYDGKMYQSNDLEVKGIVPINFTDEIYSEVAKIVREDKKYNSSKINIIKASEDTVSIEYDEKNCSVYGVKKKWKAEIGI